MSRTSKPVLDEVMKTSMTRYVHNAHFVQFFSAF